ncbi:Mannose-binding protein C, partial [Mesitornis unicolor]
ITLLQSFNALVLWLSLLMVTGSVNTYNPEQKIYSCPLIQCSALAVNGLPVRAGRDGHKGEKGQSGEGFRGLQSSPGKAGPPRIKGDLGPQGQKGEKGVKNKILMFLQSDLQPFSVFFQKLFVLISDLILKNIKSIGKKIVSTGKENILTNRKSLCAEAGNTLASPRTKAKNTALEDSMKPSKQAHIRVAAVQTEGKFMNLNGGAETYRNCNSGEPKKLKNEDYAVI